MPSFLFIFYLLCSRESCSGFGLVLIFPHSGLGPLLLSVIVDLATTEQSLIMDVYACYNINTASRSNQGQTLSINQ